MNWIIRILGVLLLLCGTILPSKSQENIDPTKLLSRISCNGMMPKWPPDLQKQAKEFIYKSDELIAKLSWEEYLEKYNKFVEIVRFYGAKCMYQTLSQQIDGCVKNIETLAINDECASLFLSALPKCSYMPYTTRRATPEVTTIFESRPKPPPFIAPVPGSPPRVPTPGELLPFFPPITFVHFAPPDDGALQNFQSTAKAQFDACTASDKTSSFAERLEQTKTTIADRRARAEAELKATASLLCIKNAGLCE